MTRHEIAALACKILALWLFSQVAFYGIPFLMMITVSLFGGLTDRGINWDQIWASLMSGLLPLGSLIVAIVIWRKAEALATRMVRPGADTGAVTGVSTQDALGVAVTAIGVFLIVPALQEGLQILIGLVRHWPSRATLWSDGAWQAQVASWVVYLAVCLWLIFGARGIVRIIGWARTAGIQKERAAHARTTGCL